MERQSKAKSHQDMDGQQQIVAIKQTEQAQEAPTQERDWILTLV